MGLLRTGLADVKLPCLAVMVSEGFRSYPTGGTLQCTGMTAKAGIGVFPRTTVIAPTVGLVVGAGGGVAFLHMPILLEVVHRAFRGVNRQAVEVWPAQALDLSVQIGKLRPCNKGSSVKSMPGAILWVQKATCSVSAKKFSTTRLSTSLPTGCTG